MGSSLTIPETINVDEIIENTGLSKKQINALWKRFYELDRDAQGDGKGYKNYLNAGDLSRVPKFDENPIAPRLIDVILEDYGSNGCLTFAQFVNFMTTFGQTGRGGHDHHHHSKRGSLPSAATKTSSKTDAESVKFSLDDTPKTRKVKFIFRMYDVDRDGHLSREDIQQTLKLMVGKISDEEASIIAERVIGEFTDEQINGVVNLESFEKTLRTLDFNDKMGLKLLK